MKKVKRLYDEFKPEHYELWLEPNRESMSFNGTILILGHKTGRPSKRITLHQKGLKIKKAEIVRFDKRAGETTLKVERINNHAKFDELRLHTAETLFAGKYQLKLTFGGKINEQMHGMYPCNFEIGGKPKKLIATQFESHYAREVFPCIDEPEAKATFDLLLTTPAGETVIANTPIKRQVKEKTKLHSSFETTPKMSTYLLAFAFGELKYHEAKTKRGITVRTYATPDKVAFTNFALDVAKDCLDFYESYFKIDYPLPKLDMIALPDFSSGAMENWGLVTYREQAMLVDPKNTSLEMKQYVAMVIAHELAHQWFGNLVTMQWWTDLWLNEGFASWIEYLAVDKLFPGWNIWTQYIVEDQLMGLRADSLANTHPIEVSINHPDEIRTIFDDISYQKGSAVIHMLQAYLGAEAFRRGLTHYLKKHAYKNAVTQDLWQALEETSGKPVRRFMHAWVGKPGYPLLQATVESSKLRLHQERFFALKNSKHQDDTTWPIPLNAAPNVALEVLDTKNERLAWPQPVAPLLNQGHSGFYVTIYDEASYSAFGKSIESSKLGETDRLGLINDAFMSAKAGYVPTASVLDMLGHFKHETSAPVWDSLAIILGDIRRVFDDEALQESMKPYVKELTARQVKRLGWQPKPTESHFDMLLRPTILGLASWANNQAIRTEALRRFKKMKRPEDEHPDLRSVIYFTAARNGGAAEFNKLKKMYEQSKTASEKVTLAGALTTFKQPELYKKALSLIKSDLVRAQDISYWISYSFSNRHAKAETWKWLKKNWRWIQTNLGTELGFSRMPAYAARVFSDPAFKKSYREFFEPRLSPALEREYRKGLETIEWQAKWRQREFDQIKDFFNNAP